MMTTLSEPVSKQSENTSTTQEDYFPSLLEHPAFKEIQHLGFGSPDDQFRAHQVFVDLSECKGWWNMRLYGLRELQKIVISGHESRTTCRSHIIPVHSQSHVSHSEIQRYISAVRDHQDSIISEITPHNSAVRADHHSGEHVISAVTPHESGERVISDRADHQSEERVISAVRAPQHSGESIILALVDDSSNIIYYGVSDSLCPPEPPDAVERKHAKQQRVYERRKQTLDRVRNQEQEAKQSR